jgi:membrane protease YdiL (CAAX protease family)
MDDQRSPEVPEASPSPQDPDFFTVLSVSFELGLIPVAWFIAWIWPGPMVPAAHWTYEATLAGILATLPLIVLLAAITWTPARLLAPLRRIRRRIRKILGPTLKDIRIWQVLLISIAAGIGEEVLFRGAVQGRAGMIITSLIFGLLHWITPTYALLAVVLGGYMGWLFQTTGNLLVPIIVHALYDFVALIVIRNEVRRQDAPTHQEKKQS